MSAPTMSTAKVLGLPRWVYIRAAKRVAIAAALVLTGTISLHTAVLLAVLSVYGVYEMEACKWIDVRLPSTLSPGQRLEEDCA